MPSTDDPRRRHAGAITDPLRDAMDHGRTGS